MINILPMRSAGTSKDVSVSPLNTVAAARSKSFSVAGGYVPNSLELESFSGTFLIDTNLLLISSSGRVTESELSRADIKIYSNTGNLAGVAQSGQIFIDPVKSWFGLVFQVETTIGLGIASMRLLFDYPAKFYFCFIAC